MPPSALPITIAIRAILAVRPSIPVILGADIIPGAVTGTAAIIEARGPIPFKGPGII